MLTKKLYFLASLTFLIFSACGTDETPKIIPDDTAQGVFIDSPVSGLQFSSDGITGMTNDQGTFEYRTGKEVTFKVGDILLGDALGKEKITPLDLVSGSDINTSRVQNIASFLQSLDTDRNASNGISISADANQSLQGKDLDFDSPSFVDDLETLIAELNSANSTSLAVVDPFEAAVHMANTLNLSDEIKLWPTVIEGRQWEEGEYYSYNTVQAGEEYILKVGTDLEDVRLNFGNGMGYYMDMEYTQDTLSGYGNFFRDLYAEEPVDSVQGSIYTNRISSPGLVFDYGENTYAGLNTYYKTEGELGQLPGTYKAFFFEEVLLFDEEPDVKWVFHNELMISEPDLDGKYTVTLNRIAQSSDPVIYHIQKEDIAGNNIMLIRFQNTDHIFIKKEAMEQLFDPNEFLIKK
ncbi:hypothetical protein [Salinimicrobium soli]|uniref:hypothetical protein n=1 Tax=Salinimicrobium soli TaxID=1254399 RepID=UPI003AAE2D54